MAALGGLGDAMGTGELDALKKSLVGEIKTRKTAEKSRTKNRPGKRECVAQLMLTGTADDASIDAMFDNPTRANDSNPYDKFGKRDENGVIQRTDDSPQRLGHVDSLAREWAVTNSVFSALGIPVRFNVDRRGDKSDGTMTGSMTVSIVTENGLVELAAGSNVVTVDMVTGDQS